MDGSDVHTVSRSPTEQLLATGDNFGKVNVYNYPSMTPNGSVHNSYAGHSSHVTNVRWVSFGMAADMYLISCGGGDKCVFVWEVQSEDGTTGNKKAIKSKSGSSEGSGSFHATHESTDGFEDFPTAGGNISSNL